MPNKIQKIAVIGDGGWGTTLSIHLARKNFDVFLWGAFLENINHIQETHFNEKFLPGIEIPPTIALTNDLSLAVKNSELLVLAVPSQYLKDVLKKLKKFNLSNKIFLSVIKGIDTVHLKRMSVLISDMLGDVPLAVLSGPTIAPEVAQGIPSTAVIASAKPGLAKTLQQIFHSESFRIYTNRDVIGVELGGSLKNIIAIACGVCDGLGFGTNTKAAILTRGLVEIARLGISMGARKSTFAGLAGLGDLVTTCVSAQSRNRHVGEELGKGRTPAEIIASMSMVAEGVVTVKAAYKLSCKYKISMPITHEVYNILYRNKSPQKAVLDLMTRQLKSE